MRTHKTLLALPSLFIMLAWSFNAHALITNSTVSPTSRTVAANTPASIPITWRLTRNGTIGTTVIQSARIVIRLDNSNGVIVSDTSKSLSKTVNIVNNIEFITFAESITIPRDIIYRATKAGQKLIVQREFTDDNFTNSFIAELPVNVGGGASGSFAISRIDLAFDDGSTVCVDKTGKDRTAIATITASGTGMLRGAWEVREGGGLGSFRILRTVQVPISSGRPTLVQSPALPTGSAGDRLEVRLVIDTPTLSFTAPTITCSTTGKDNLVKDSENAKNLAKVLGPEAHAPLNADTNVKWEAVKGAKSYRIEILANEDGEPLAAQLVKAGQTSAKLSPLTLEKLESDDRYIVRVVAE